LSFVVRVTAPVSLQVSPASARLETPYFGM
jgi:hypothetical protein